MQLGFGPDFFAAKQGELYSERSGQPLWLAALFVVVLYLILTLLQTVIGLLFIPLIGGPPVSFTDPVSLQSALVKATIVGLLPSSLIAAFICWKFSAIKNATGVRGLPLHVPNLGVAGWFVIVVGLMVFLWAVFNLTFVVLGIDPATYAPTKDGINDVNSSAGIVEKVLADLADEPLLFALALPGVTLAVPIVEEFVFRGALFSALRYSWFGKTGAVVLTAAAWALVHGMAAPWLFVFIIFIMGIALGLLLLRYGSLTVTIAAHACWNAFSSLAIFSGQ
jgi:membrane protease YdiL (CAAX protease family)